MVQEDRLTDRLRESVTLLSERLQADIVLYSGPMGATADSEFVQASCARKRRPNVGLLLTTNGGSADAAYRIARCLRRNYTKVVIFIDDYCKSAGTLLALAADELVMTDMGELGPLDVQLYKPDELGEVSSGLTPMQALSTLQAQAFESFESHFLQLRVRSDFQITTKSASEIATNITTGLFAPIYQQIDPMRLGEIDRATRIALEYGKRIGSKNLKPDALERLVADYPSHEFIIDRDEAKELFKSVRQATEDEQEFFDLVHPIKHLLNARRPYIFLDDLFQQEEQDDETEEPAHDGHGQGNAAQTREEPRRVSDYREDGAQPAERNGQEAANPGRDSRESTSPTP